MKKYLPIFILVLGLVWLASALRPQKSDSGYDLAGFGRLPILANGRIKPMDTVARSALLQLQGRQGVANPTGVALTFAEKLTYIFKHTRPDGKPPLRLEPTAWLL
ncbi:MAG: cytochrome C biogenesis protein, partial [Opitutaceae bacterium]|nr:cytochrome C biogenesis protein [Opitutaceae bacterium]